jgi:L-rhamnose mutarotase
MKKLLSFSLLIFLLVPFISYADVIDYTRYNPHHQYPHQKMYQEFLNLHKEEVVHYLSTYLNETEAALNSILKNQDNQVNSLVNGAAISKLTNQPINKILQEKMNHVSFRELKIKYNVTQRQFHREMKNLQYNITKKIQVTNEVE